MQRLIVLVLLLFIFIVTGCGEREVTLPMFQIKDNLYVVTNEPIDENEIEEEVGFIKTETKELPQKNGEGYRIKKGTVLYKVKGENIKGDLSKLESGLIAILDEDGQYRGANRYFSEEDIEKFAKPKK